MIAFEYHLSEKYLYDEKWDNQKEYIFLYIYKQIYMQMIYV